MKKIRWYHFAFVVCWPILGLLYPHRFSGRENIPEGACIVCPNHSHALDPIFVGLAMGWRHYVHFLAKAETAEIPVVSWIMKKVEAIFVHRGESDINAFKQCLRALKSGEKLLIFPEGTRVRGTDRVEPKKGAVRMAAKTGVPIVPVYVTQNPKIFHPLRVVIGEPRSIPSDPHTDYDALARETMELSYALGRESA